MILNLERCWKELNGKDYQEEPETESKYSLFWILYTAASAASLTALIALIVWVIV